MKQRPPSPPVVQLVPALIAKRGKGGTSFRSADEYDQGKEGAQLLDTNLEGRTPRERAREVAHLRAASRLKRAVDHWSLSVDPRLGKLTDDQWRQVGQNFIDQMFFQGCAYTLTRHVDEPQDHIHLTLLRIRPDGTTVSDANDFKRSHEAAARCASAIGLMPLPPRPEATWSPAPTDTQLGANKRAKRRGTKNQNHASIARAFDHLVSKAVDLPDLESKMMEVDLELEVVRKSGGAVQGLNVRAAGAEEWLKASGLKSDRSLSWSKVGARLAGNLELRERAQAQAEQVAAVARDRAEVRVADRIGKQPDHQVPQQARALRPDAIRLAKEASMDNTHDFFNSPSQPRPADLPLDDAGLLIPMHQGVAAASEAVDRNKKVEKDRDERERDQAMLDMQSELRRLSVKELLDLRSSVPPFVLSAAAIERLVNLMIRLLTLGLVKRVDNLSDALAAREELREHADRELDRRRRLPSTVGDRKKFLEEYAEAVQERTVGLDKRRSDRKHADAYRDSEREAAQGVALRKQLEAGLDRRQVARGHDTIKKRRADHKTAALAHRAAREALANLVPAGVSGVFITKEQRHAAAADKAAAETRAKQAAERRAAAKEQLQVLLDEVEEEAVRLEQEAAENLAAVAKAEAIERDALARELRSLPDEIIVVNARAQQVHHAERGAALVADAARLRTAAEIEAEAAEAEAERIRRLTMINRG